MLSEWKNLKIILKLCKIINKIYKNEKGKIYMEKTIKKSKAPMVLGIVSLVAWIIPLAGWVISIIGIVMSSLKLKELGYKAYKISLTLNIIGLILSVVTFISTMMIALRQIQF